MTKEQKVASIGPGMVDMAFDMTKRPQEYQTALEILETQPGGWRSIEDSQQFNELMELLIGRILPKTLEDLVSLQTEKQFELIAGSSNLGTLVALTETLRRQSAFISAVGSSDGKIPDYLSRFFTRSLQTLGITHYYEVHKGCSPTGVVLGMKDENDKVLAIYPGVMSELSVFPETVCQPDVVQVDAYELRKQPIGRVIEKTIISGRYKIALGLGNPAILKGGLRDQVLSYIQNSRLTFLTGNEQEFIQLLGISTSHLEKDIFGEIAGELPVPHVLITLDERGLVALHQGKVHFQAAFPVPKTEIINTSGAGDTAAGVFIAGILEGTEIQTILRESVYFASQVLKLPGSRLPTGR